jgi:hypothetical protein
MLAEQFHAAAAGANTYASIDNVSRLIWRAHGAGHLSDAAAQTLAETLQARRAALAARTYPNTQKRAGGPPKAIRPRSPDRERSIRRRRAVAMSGAIPSKLAAAFTLGEIAALSVIAREVQRRGQCELCLDAIAAQAGTCRTVAQGALRQARALGLVHVQERPQPGRKHLPNVVTIAAPDWCAWLREHDKVWGAPNAGDGIPVKVACAAPHFVMLPTSSYTTEQLRHLFNDVPYLTDRIRSFQTDRLVKITAGDTPIAPVLPFVLSEIFGQG